MESAGGTLRLQAGGTVGDDAFYIERAADRELFEALGRGELCYVLSTRQIGKSSLRHRTSRRLRARGTLCVTIDLTRVGSADATPDTWYFDLTHEIAEQLGLDPPDAFWDEHPRIGPVHAFARYLSHEVLAKTADPVVIFIDEIDAMLSLPFSRDDFFAAVRAFYNERPDRPEHRRLTFCLLGVAAPGDLIEDPTRTPFNVGRAVYIEDFTREEISVLGAGLAALDRDPGALLDEVFAWTHGHPYMTLRVCDDLVRDRRGADLETVLHERFLQRGRTADANLAYAESHFDAARTRGKDARAAQMLALYERLLRGDAPAAEGDDPTQLALRLSGLAAERTDARGRRVLAVRNRIFSEVFDLAWARSKQAERSIAEPVSRWLDSGRRDDFLLRGEALAEVRRWAAGRDDLSREEREFLEAGVLADQRDKARAAEARARAQEASAKAELAQELALVKKDHKEALLAKERIREAEERSRVAVDKAREAVERASAAEREAGERASAAERRASALAAQIAQAEREHRRALAEQEAASRQAMAEQRALAAAERRRLEALIPRVRAWIVLGSAIAAPSLVLLAAPRLREMWTNSQAEERVSDAKARAQDEVDEASARARKAADERDVWRLAARAREAAQEITPQTGLLLSVSALRRARDVLGSDAAQPLRQALVDAMHGVPARRPLSAQCDGDVRMAGPGAGQVVFVSGDARVCLWNAGLRRGIPLGDAARTATFVALSLDGRRVVTAPRGSGPDRISIVRLWEADHATKPIQSIRVSGLASVALSPDGTRIAVASSAGVASVWSADGKDPQRHLEGHSGAIHSVAFSTDGRLVVTASEDHTARVWTLDGDREPQVLSGHEDAVLSAAFDHDGRHIATISADHTVRVWSSGGEIGRFGVSPDADAVAFIGRSSSLVIASRNGSVRRWAPGYKAPGAPLLDARKEGITGLVLSADGRSVVTASGGGERSIWDLDLDQRTGQVGFGRDIPEDERLIKMACDLARRNLSRHEWDRIVNGVQYDRGPCPDHPED